MGHWNAGCGIQPCSTPSDGLRRVSRNSSIAAKRASGSSRSGPAIRAARRSRYRKVSGCTSSAAAGREKPGVRGTVRALYDHHTVLADASGLDVSDVVEFGLSHPCAAFDRWPEYFVTGGDGAVIDVWRTEFGRASTAEPLEGHAAGSRLRDCVRVPGETYPRQ